MFIRSNGAFSILEDVNPNAYKVDLLEEYGVSATSLLTDLRPYFSEEDELPRLREKSFQAEGNDGDQAQGFLMANEV